MTLFKAKSSKWRGFITRVLLLCLVFSLFPKEMLEAETASPRSYFRPMQIKLLRNARINEKPFSINEDDVAIVVERTVPIAPKKKKN